jgi:hypothetical protein
LKFNLKEEKKNNKIAPKKERNPKKERKTIEKFHHL